MVKYHRGLQATGKKHGARVNASTSGLKARIRDEIYPVPLVTIPQSISLSFLHFFSPPLAGAPSRADNGN